MKPTIRPKTEPEYQQVYCGQMRYIAKQPYDNHGIVFEPGKLYYVDAVMNVYTMMVFARATSDESTTLLTYVGLGNFEKAWEPIGEKPRS